MQRLLLLVVFLALALCATFLILLSDTDDADGAGSESAPRLSGNTAAMGASDRGSDESLFSDKGVAAPGIDSATESHARSQVASSSTAGSQETLLVRARLVDQHGRPMQGATLTVARLLSEDDPGEGWFWDHFLDVSKIFMGHRVDGIPTHVAKADANGRAKLQIPHDFSSLLVFAGMEAHQIALSRQEIEEGSKTLDAGELILLPATALEILVLDEQGRGIPGALVHLSGSEAQHEQGLTYFFHETDSTGRCLSPFLSPGHWSVDVGAPTFVGTRMSLELSEIDKVHQRRITLKKGVRLEGRVQYANGSPASGVEILFEEFEEPDGDPPELELALVSALAIKNWPKTGPDGRFQIDGLDANSRYVVTAVKSDDIQPTSEPVKPGEEALIVLPPMAVVSGRVVAAENGQPLPGARVWLIESSEVDSSRQLFDAIETGSDGSFRSELAVGHYEICVRHSYGERVFEEAVDATGEAEVGALRIPKGSDLVIHLQDDSGEPVEQAKIQATLNRYDPPIQSGVMRRLTWNRKFEAFGPGRYRTRGVRPGRHHFRVNAQGFARHYFSVEVLVGQTTEITERLSSAASLTVTARYPDGQPGADRSIQLAPLSPSSQTRRGTRSWEQDSDEHGAAYFPDLPPNTYEVFVDLGPSERTGDDARPITTVTVQPGENTIELTLEALHALIVIVRDGAGNPVQGAAIWHGTDANAPYFDFEDDGETTDEHGRMEIEKLSSGRHSVAAARQGGLSNRASVDLVGPGQEVILQLSGRHIRGKVVGANQEARVWLFNQAGFQKENAHTPRIDCGTDGDFEFRDLPPGAYWLRVHAEGYYQTEDSMALIQVDDRDIDGLRLELRKGGRVVVQVRGLDEEIDSKYVLRVLDAEARRLRVDWIDHNGTFEFAGLHPGEYSIQVCLLEADQLPHADDRVLAEYPVSVSDGSVVEFEWSAE